RDSEVVGAVHGRSAGEQTTRRERETVRQGAGGNRPGRSGRTGGRQLLAERRVMRHLVEVGRGNHRSDIEGVEDRGGVDGSRGLALLEPEQVLVVQVAVALA